MSRRERWSEVARERSPNLYKAPGTSALTQRTWQEEHPDYLSDREKKAALAKGKKDRGISAAHQEETVRRSRVRYVRVQLPEVDTSLGAGGNHQQRKITVVEIAVVQQLCQHRAEEVREGEYVSGHQGRDPIRDFEVDVGGETGIQKISESLVDHSPWRRVSG